MAARLAVCVRNTFIDLDIVGPPAGLRRARSEADVAGALAADAAALASPLPERRPPTPPRSGVAFEAEPAVCVKNTFICVPEPPPCSALRRAQSERCSRPVDGEEDATTARTGGSDDEAEAPCEPADLCRARTIDEYEATSPLVDSWWGAAAVEEAHGGPGVRYVPAVVYVPMVVPLAMLRPDSPEAAWQEQRWWEAGAVQCDPPFVQVGEWPTCACGPLGVERVPSADGQSATYRWTADARKLRSSTKKVGSPAFTVALPGVTEPLELKIFIRPASVSECKGGSSFKASKGRGSLELHCLQCPAGADSLPLRFRFGLGSQPPRGLVCHDFSKQTTCGLPEAEKWWDLCSEVDPKTDTFVVQLEVVA